MKIIVRNQSTRPDHTERVLPESGFSVSHRPQYTKVKVSFPFVGIQNHALRIGQGKGVYSEVPSPQVPKDSPLFTPRTTGDFHCRPAELDTHSAMSNPHGYNLWKEIRHMMRQSSRHQVPVPRGYPKNQIAKRSSYDPDSEARFMDYSRDSQNSRRNTIEIHTTQAVALR